MEMKENEKKSDTKEQLIVLSNKSNLSVSGTNNTTRAEINGNINSLKFLEKHEKEPFFRKLFK